MFGIDILIQEHDTILKFAQYYRNLSCDFMMGKDITTEEFREGIRFIRIYADKHHHGKEEQILFRVMKEELGEIAYKLITNGMLIEHDLGRFHVQELEKALLAYEKNPSSENKMDVVVNAVSYTNLIKRHAEKENSVVFTFAMRSLSKETLEQINKESKQFEQQNQLNVAFSFLN